MTANGLKSNRRMIRSGYGMTEWGPGFNHIDISTISMSFLAFHLTVLIPLLLSRFINKLRRQRPNTRQNLNRKLIPVSQILLRLIRMSHARRGTCQNDGTRLQRCPLGAKTYNLWDGEDQITYPPSASRLFQSQY